MSTYKKMNLGVVCGAVLLVVLTEVTCNPPLQLEPLVAPLWESSPIKTLAGIRLPREVSPVHYDLEIRPILHLPLDDPEQFTAPGTVTIRLHCVAETTSITLHSDDIDIEHDSVTVIDVANSAPIQVTGHTNDSSISTYTINLGGTLTANQDYDLFIPFVAKVGDRLSGLYRSSYIDGGGNQRWLATTQFQKLGARQTFPCFDEPNFKSTFTVTIGRTVDFHSLANSPLNTTAYRPEFPDTFWDIHEKTVSMPSYLIAIIISDFVSVDAPEGISSYTVKTWGPPTTTTNATGEFSSKAAAQILDFFEKYFDSPYQFPKLDSVAVPDFEAGAMENWALNTYRTNLMLWFEGESTQYEQWRQASVIAHEISHHWFGDLVTCDWWNDIWLNEGFARYLQFIGANASLTQHGVMDRYTIDVIQLAMENDAGSNTEPVRSNVTDEMTNQNSRIIYEKGASLLRMMQGFLTEETLIAALRNYLDTHEYGNTVQDNLFEAIQTQVDQDGTLVDYSVKEIMDTWTLKSGFPLVTLNYATANLAYITQEKFLPLEQRLINQAEGELWYVPIAYASKSNPDFSVANLKPKLWLDKYTLVTSTAIEGSTNQWVILNPDARSYFRVNYDNHFFSMILDQLNEDHLVISLSSRSQIIDDYFKSAFQGYVTIEQAMDLTKYLSEERENTVWTTVFNNLRQTNRLLQDSTATYTKFKDYLLGKVTPALDRIGWEQLENEMPVTVILRSQLLDWACVLGSPKCTEVTTTYATALATGTAIPADIQPMIYCKAVSIVDTLVLPGFDLKAHVKQGYVDANRVERYTLFLNSLACNTPVKDEIDALLDAAIADPSDFTTAHSIQLIQRISENPENRGTLISYFNTMLTPIINRLGDKAVGDVVQSMAAYTSDPNIVEQMKQLISLARALVNESVRASLDASLAQLGKNAEWVATYAPRLDAWISAIP